MNGIVRVRDIDELLGMLTVLEVLSQPGMLHKATTCLTNGLVLCVVVDGKPISLCLVNTDHDTGVLLSVPTDEGRGYAKACISEVRKWAKANHVKSLRVVSDKMNGSSFRYFEKSLGFKRKAVVFNMKIE